LFSSSQGPRIYTFFLYFSDVEEGGETNFPKARPEQLRDCSVPRIHPALHSAPTPYTLSIPQGARHAALTPNTRRVTRINAGRTFPKLDIDVKPRKGRAVLWPSVLDEDATRQDPRTTHQAKPVITGTKFAANSWIHNYNYREPNLWGCTGSFE
jgi:hypothetical protein